MHDAEINTSSQSPVRFLRVFVVACLCFAVVLTSVNYFVDRYYVFHNQTEPLFESLEPNTRYLKAAYLETHCSAHDAVVMGSSRDVGYLTTDIDRVFGVKSYNYGVAAGNLRGVLGRLEWLASKDCLPGQVFLPISIDRMRLPQRPDDLLRKEHPAIVGSAGYSREFFLSYIGTDAFVSNIRKLLRLIGQKDEPKFRYDMTSGDVFYLWDRTFELDVCDFSQDRAEAPVIKQFAEFLFSINSLVEQNGGTLTLFWNPQPLNSQISHVEESDQLFSLLAGRMDHIYRLPLSDERLTDSVSYHDQGHFKHALGTAVFENPDHRVGLDQLLSELVQAAKECE